MQFSRELRRLLLGILLLFGMVALSAAYWAVVGPDTISTLKDNPRLVEAEASIVRGDILDRHDTPLATSVQNADHSVTRRYLRPETYSALGYFSLRYGVGGAEAAFNTALRGDDLERNLTTYFSQNTLHVPTRGSSIRLTLDVTVQESLVQAMGSRQGAAVVMSVPSGEILALVSLPTYDPNTLDENWDRLKTAPGNPFFNRVLQGNYQPGGMLETPLMATALLANQPTNAPIDDASAPVTVNKVVLNCATKPPSTTLTLAQAYAFACPAPFAQLVNQQPADGVQAMLDAFLVNPPPTLPGFIAATVDDQTPPAPTATPTPVPSLLENALGQGQLTTTPLGMAAMTASIVNDGNAPQPLILLGVRRPDTDDWTPTDISRPQLPVTTADTARQLADLMRQSVKQGAAQNANRTGIDIGGHAALAYSGEGSQAWFVGFAVLDDKRAVVVAIVLENSTDPAEAADIGGKALEAAYRAQSQTTN